MTVDPVTVNSQDGRSGWKELDEIYDAFLSDHPDHSASWLIQQALLTSQERRSLLSSLDVHAGWNVLDVGTGYGTIAVELAHLHHVNVVGVDKDHEVLIEATQMLSQLSGWLDEGSSVRFQRDDMKSLSFDSEQFDLVTARLVFQHIAEPEQAIAELARVLRHGGYIWVFDVDDAMGISYPTASPAKETLDRSFASWQRAIGGDREIGRKLPSYLSNQGFYVKDVQVVSQAQFSVSRPGDRFRSATAAQYRGLRNDFVDAGVIGGQEFDDALESFETEPPLAQMRIESQVVVLAQKP